ncbi:MAG: cell wall hydrolase [Lachnospiraceae bacterium]|nr:cell wall hydrolase [Lachnospiraceae bacterium]
MFSKNVVRSLAGLGIMAALLFVSPVLTTQAAEVVSTVVSTTATVNGSALKIRQNASIGATVLGIAFNGDSFTVTGVVDNEWLSVSYRGRTAYIASDFVTLKTVRSQVVTIEEEESAAAETAESTASEEVTTAEATTEAVKTAEEPKVSNEVKTAENTVTQQATAEATTVAVKAAPAVSASTETSSQATERKVSVTETTAPAELLAGIEAVTDKTVADKTVAEESIATEETIAEETAAIAEETVATEVPAEETVTVEETASAEIAAVEIPAEETSVSSEEVVLAEEVVSVEEAAPAEATAEEQNIENAAQSAYSEEDLKLLAALIYCEAVGESYEGKVAVGEVVMNRVASTRYPDSVSGVIYDAGQFTPVSSGKFARILANGITDEACLQAAAQALTGSDTVGACTRFNRVKASSQGTVIGNHVFWG